MAEPTIEELREVVRRASALFWRIDNYRVTYRGNEQREAGYKQAMEELIASDEVMSLKEAVAQLARRLPTGGNVTKLTGGQP